MTPDQFNAALKAAIAHDAVRENSFACYPMITISENSHWLDFAAFYVEGGITVRGFYTNGISPNQVAMVKRMADELETSPEYKDHGLEVVGCFLIPCELISKVNKTAFGEHNHKSVVIFGVSIGNGLPVFTQYLFEDESAGLVRY